jgi:prepilin-type processing-associated H-X9-DG protein
LICPSLQAGTPNQLNNQDYLSLRNGSYGYNFGYLGNNRTMVDGDNSTPTLYYPVRSVPEPSRTIVFGDSRGGTVGHGGHSKTLDPPHMVIRSDGLTVNSPYWLQAPFNGTALAGVNLSGPDEGTPDIQTPFSPAEARHKGLANVVFLDGHAASLSLPALGYVTVNGIPQLQTTSSPLPGADNSLWTGRGLDETSPFYNTP